MNSEYNYVKYIHMEKDKKRTNWCLWGSRTIRMYIYTHMNTHSKKVNVEKHSTLAVGSEVSAVGGQLSKSPDRSSMGSRSSSGF